MNELDVVYVIDGRFEGGVSTAVASELDELFRHNSSIRVGLLLVRAHLLRLPWPVHGGIRAHVSSGRLRVLRPGEHWHAQLALVHHPVVFRHLPRTALPVSADRAILILHHPMFDNDGTRQYDIAEVQANTAATLAPEVLIAPVSPVVRRALGGHTSEHGAVVDEEWINLIDPDRWPFDPDRPPPNPGHVVLGRHARPHPQKWPDTWEEAAAAHLAHRPEVEFRILGAGDFLAEHYGRPMPPNWVERPFDAEGVPEFLSNLDFYVYYHSSTWLEAFGRTVLEALACGLVTVLPPHFEELFGEAAVYAAPEDVSDIIDGFLDDIDAWRAQRIRARRWVLRHHNVRHRVEDRLKLYGLREIVPVESPAIDLGRKAPVLFLSTNGIGVGHLTQQLAIADRLPKDEIQPVFASMSFSLRVARDAGYPVFYLPHHRHLDAGPEPWNRIFAEEVFDLIRHVKPALLAYDGTAVFGGLANVLREFPDMISLWVRRAMWREYHRHFLEHSDLFTGVLEPGELAGDLDHGPTREVRDDVHLVQPVLHIDPEDRHDRATARAAYGLKDGDLAVALQMGSGANFDVRDLREAVIELLMRDPRVRVLEIVSPLAAMPTRPAGTGERLIQIREFPSFRNSRALDAAIGVAGYNSFHEQILGGIPTVFVPNEAEEMDSQLTRAQWAEVMGLGLCLRARHDIGALAQTVRSILDDDERARLRNAMAALPPARGAQELAEIITDHSAMVRTDIHPERGYRR
ncbi:glycosyltransferase family protein [Maliponia aquimaris]|uniref:UDP-N-acetylglucosamine--N-acetylmuramyl-(Pentapeptide) pyrophosphoryl-undecaprenol N-acetylglucosamine transferase n=1 Tax=Maliponia aquimaris TaxID=1673631 RepID=A0A238L4J1_9RHOB|nr:glycosyltransferase [Maliponia aquimaris]SMX50003.1 UDP-N-acetylglucosamine--N-acetylmuramyl-(pentapeptide) pyrophosphoryl-undecaprenol N-acetylglucosamine transferase [Maliponia aquimaris]